jgi:DNA-binding beta-propeller fold protein YncE
MKHTLAGRAILLPILLWVGPEGFPGEKAPQPLELIRETPLPGFTGDFDHFAVDLKGGRLFLAGEGHQTVEVFDLGSGRRLKSITGFGTPHAIVYIPETDRILVTDGEKGQVQTLRGTDYGLLGHIDGLAGADSARLDPTAQILYVVTGGKDVPLEYSFLVAIDLRHNSKVGELRFESNHLEAFALDASSSRLFINVTDKHEVAVVDRKTLQVTARWPVSVAEENSPLVYDEGHRRLLIVCRKPGMLVVMDSESGKLVASLPAAGRSDDIALDPLSGRVYVPGGEGYVSVFERKAPDTYELLSKVATAPGAKTSLLVPSLARFFVAVSPGDTKAPAKILTFRVVP